MRTYRQARHGDKRQDLWIGTAVVQESDGRRWVDFEDGDRSAAPFLRRYARLPEGEQYRRAAYAVYGSWLPSGRYVVRKGAR